VIRLGEQRSVGEKLDLAAVETLRNGGRVYAVPPDDMPTAKPVAAVLRY
jgi:hypothetical protein